MMTDEEYAHAGIDRGYIERAAMNVADEMQAGRPVEFRYEPGDMTSYGLVLADLSALSLVEVSRAGWAASRVFRGVGDGEAWFLLVWDDHASVVLDWTNLPVATYLASKLSTTPTSGASILMLLDAIRRWRGID